MKREFTQPDRLSREYCSPLLAKDRKSHSAHMPRSVRSGISLLNVQRVIKQLQPHKQKLRDTLPEPELAGRVPNFLSCDCELHRNLYLSGFFPISLKATEETTKLKTQNE